MYVEVRFLKHKTYIFDFDGTLVDSMPYWSQKMLDILVEEKADYPKDIIKIITPLGDLGTAKYFIEELGVKKSTEELIDRMNVTGLPYYRDIIIAKPGVAEYLRFLKDNNCSLNVLTASPHLMLDPCLKRNGIYDIFDNVWSCEDFGTTKSDVKIYSMAVEAIGTTMEDTVFLDDNIGAVTTAKNAGLYTVGVYDKSGEEFTEQLKEIADIYIDTFEGLKELL